MLRQCVIAWCVLVGWVGEMWVVIVCCVSFRANKSRLGNASRWRWFGFDEWLFAIWLLELRIGYRDEMATVRMLARSQLICLMAHLERERIFDKLALTGISGNAAVKCIGRIYPYYSLLICVCVSMRGLFICGFFIRFQCRTAGSWMECITFGLYGVNLRLQFNNTMNSMVMISILFKRR